MVISDANGGHSIEWFMRAVERLSVNLECLHSALGVLWGSVSASFSFSRQLSWAHSLRRELQVHSPQVQLALRAKVTHIPPQLLELSSAYTAAFSSLQNALPIIKPTSPAPATQMASMLLTDLSTWNTSFLRILP